MSGLAFRFVSLVLFSLLVAGNARADTRLLRMPDISQNHIAFVYAGDIYVANRDGSAPRRLTVHPGNETGPSFSPDGKWIAFTGNYGGNADVYIVPTGGGQPKRLTYHPGRDTARGWTADGKAVLFTSPRALRFERGGQLYKIGVDGGYPERLPMPVAFDGAYAGNGKRIAYQPFPPAQNGASGWKRYRGGTTPPIWLFDFATSNIEKIPHPRVNDTAPMWVGDTVYFLSDRNRIVNLFGYDTKGKKVRQITSSKDWDVKWANATDGAVILQMGGRLHIVDTASGALTTLAITLNPDLPETRPHWVDGKAFMREPVLSPSGVRAAFSVRGDIVTIPTDKGNIHRLTASSDSHQRNPLWSPDGQSIAWVSDDGGEYELIIGDQNGGGESRRYPLGDPAFYTLYAWSPDGKSIAYTDNHLNLYVLDLESGKHRKVDTQAFSWSTPTEVAFSPDSGWMAYTRVLPNYMRALMLFDMKDGKSHRVTEGLAETGAPVFSRDGKYLYFTASTNFGPSTGRLDMSSQEQPVRRGLYVAVLTADGKTPLMPETGNEKGDEAKAGDKKDEDKKDENGDKGDKDKGDKGDKKKAAITKIDLKGLSSRVIALPVAKKNYQSLAVAADGGLLYLEVAQPGVVINPPGSERQAVNLIHRYNFKKREESTFKGKVAGFTVSADGKKLLASGAHGSWSVFDATSSKGGKPKALKLGGLKLRIDPRAEWHQMYREAWRLMRDFFYDPGMHGADWNAVYEKYLPLVDHVGRREDLNFLMIEMLGEIVVGHARIFRGDIVKSPGPAAGLLGADFTTEGGRYRISRIYSGESWNPFLAAPLAVPGEQATEGDYIIAINGHDLSAGDNIFSLLEGTAGQQTTVTINDKPSTDGAHDIIVKPVANERALRRRAWVEANREMVDKASKGRIGYIYLPNTAGAGYTYFNRYFYSQLDREALIVDERGNGGGQAANYIVDQLLRTYTASWKQRDGKLFTTPVGGIFGPKVMLIDMFAGSGGDFLPYSFKRRGGGKLIGTRTWGGLVGGGPGPVLMDGGLVNIPTLGFIYPEGKWGIENIGVPPDIEVEWTPKDVIAGHDPQLERGLKELMRDLKKYKPIKLEKAPPFPTTSRK